MKIGGNIRRPLAGTLSLLALLVNLFGWALLPFGAEASSSAATLTATSENSICHAVVTPTPANGKPICIQCFPLLSAATGALLPQAAALPPPPAIITETVPPSQQAASRPAGSVAHPARGPPRAS